MTRMEPGTWLGFLVPKVCNHNGHELYKNHNYLLNFLLFVTVIKLLSAENEIFAFKVLISLPLGVCCQRWLQQSHTPNTPPPPLHPSMEYNYDKIIYLHKQLKKQYQMT